MTEGCFAEEINDSAMHFVVHFPEKSPSGRAKRQGSATH
jgi:hypothetical protein